MQDVHAHPFNAHLRSALAVLVSAGLLLALAAPVAAAGPRTYMVTITDLTSGQPFTPPLVVAHKGKHDAFKVGQPASFAVKEIAENGNLAPALAAFPDAVAAMAPLVPAGSPGDAMFDQSVTLEVTTTNGENFLSWVSMLICTNDGFTGVDSVKLPKAIGESTTVWTAGYDAGTEINTEDFADIVPPCQGLIGVSSSDAGTGASNPALAEGGVIHHHPGIAGGADLLPSVHGWTDPVATITVTRVG